VNVRSLSPDQLQVLLALGRLSEEAPAIQADILAAARCENDGLALQALRALIRRELAESGLFGGAPYGYRLTPEGRACVRAAA
jgi:hypothetical protein